MKRGLKVRNSGAAVSPVPSVPETSPMKRGLKVRTFLIPHQSRARSRDFPDEEGTERRFARSCGESLNSCSRDFPDEEGTERERSRTGSGRPTSSRDFPDEEGTERKKSAARSCCARMFQRLPR